MRFKNLRRKLTSCHRVWVIAGVYPLNVRLVSVRTVSQALVSTSSVNNLDENECCVLSDPIYDTNGREMMAAIKITSVLKAIHVPNKQNIQTRMSAFCFFHSSIYQL